MKILITAGGTTEKIDQVRAITNHSTGRLGQALADYLAANPDTIIDYVTTKQALKPKRHSNITIYTIESALDLFLQLEALTKKEHYDAIIHSMAVSDFTPAFSFSEEQLAKNLPTSSTQEELGNWFEENEQTDTTVSKISSDTEHLVLVLKKTPKIISYLREWQPKAKIIGFKLLVDVPKKSLLAVAKNSLINNKTDFIFANDLTEIHGETHHGYLLSKDGTVEEAQSKSEIAALITEKIRLEESK
ncbi:phosphopantothenate--cysteine ligase [Enterococcus faecium]|uniref:phosphopantothenate--cysteine ligase n=1 Tax=Enterococcus faecium TaxID=1352 RepID=UPI0035CCA54E